MAIAFEETIINALAITDTSDHTSTVVMISGFIPKTIGIITTLDEIVDIQVQGSFTSAFTNVYDIDSPIAYNNENDYIVLTDYFPYMRVVASCATAPTSGALTVELAKVAQ